jgi:NADPH:quinone reductase-like Zn-dependent oxidoreductase
MVSSAASSIDRAPALRDRVALVKAILRSTYGPPDVLDLRDVPTPVPGDGDVLVRVHAASVNRADIDYLTGRPLITRLATGFRKPKHAGVGLDAAGIVEAVGSGVTRFRPGDRVFSNLTEYGHGAFAEYACAPEKAWAPMPASVSFEIAATLPEASIIAYQGLRGGSTIKPGDGVLINGASGNVGPFAVQLAKSFGAEVTGVCRTSKMDFVRSMGADHVIDYTKDDYTRMSPRYDYILDVWARRSLLAPRRVLKPGGRYAMAGGSTGAIFEGLLIGPLLSVGRDRKVGLVLNWKPFDPTDIATLSRLLEEGVIRPAIDRRYPLAEVPDALRDLQSGRPCGKLLIEIVPDEAEPHGDGPA